ncbi:MAG: ankyrin repeat domain-containing protein [Puniceicoccales bacterium]|nr:ankyrin repeat domain-containing protein [Puniceicoccales bacterium]
MKDNLRKIIEDCNSSGSKDLNKTDKRSTTKTAFNRSKKDKISSPTSLENLNAQMVKDSTEKLKKLLDAPSINWEEINKMISANPKLLTVQNSEGKTALHLAVLQENVNVVNALMEFVTQLPKTDKITCLSMRENQSGWTPLASAVANASGSKIITALISAFDSDELASHIATYRAKDNQTLLHLAVGAGKPNIVQWIIDISNKSTGGNQGQKIGEIIKRRDGNDQTPLQLAESLVESGDSSSGMNKISELLKATEKEINELENLKKLLDAPRINWKEVKKIISEYPKFLTAQNSEGKTALHLAVQQGNVGVVKALVKCIPDDNKKDYLNVQNYYERTPLHLAAQQGNFDIVKALVECIPNDNKKDYLNVQDYYGWTPLHLAVEQGNFNVVNAFIAQINDLPDKDRIACLIMEDKSGQTPLASAVADTSSDEIINALVSAFNGDELVSHIATYQDKEGQTLLHLAKVAGNPSVTKMISKFSENLPKPEDELRGLLNVPSDKINWGKIKEMIRENLKLLTVQNSKGQTALHLIVQEGNVGAVRTLYARIKKLPVEDIAAFLDLQDNNGQTPLTLAKSSKGSSREIKEISDLLKEASGMRKK